MYSVVILFKGRGILYVLFEIEMESEVLGINMAIQWRLDKGKPPGEKRNITHAQKWETWEARYFKLRLPLEI